MQNITENNKTYVKAIGRYQGDEQTTCMCRQFKDTGGEQTTCTCRLLEDEAIWKYRPILYIYVYDLTPAEEAKVVAYIRNLKRR